MWDEDDDQDDVHMSEGEQKKKAKAAEITKQTRAARRQVIKQADPHGEMLRRARKKDRRERQLANKAKRANVAHVHVPSPLAFWESRPWKDEPDAFGRDTRIQRFSGDLRKFYARRTQYVYTSL